MEYPQRHSGIDARALPSKEDAHAKDWKVVIHTPFNVSDQICAPQRMGYAAYGSHAFVQVRDVNQSSLRDQSSWTKFDNPKANLYSERPPPGMIFPTSSDRIATALVTPWDVVRAHSFYLCRRSFTLTGAVHIQRLCSRRQHVQKTKAASLPLINYGYTRAPRTHQPWQGPRLVHMD